MVLDEVLGGVLALRDGKSMSSGHLWRFLFFSCTSLLRSDVQGYGEIGVLADTLCLFSMSCPGVFVEVGKV